jgi:ABC-2 type transport system permease protein
VKALWIALANLRRMFRTRANIFFAFVFPMLLILVLGATFGGSSTPRLGVVSARSGPLGAALVRQLQRTPQVKVVSVADPASLLTEVERGNVAAGIVIPPDYDRAVRTGHTAAVRYLARPDQSSQQLGETVRGAVAEQATPASARPWPGRPRSHLHSPRSRCARPPRERHCSRGRWASSTRVPGPSSCCSCS